MTVRAGSIGFKLNAYTLVAQLVYKLGGCLNVDNEDRFFCEGQPSKMHSHQTTKCLFRTRFSSAVVLTLTLHTYTGKNRCAPAIERHLRLCEEQDFTYGRTCPRLRAATSGALLRVFPRRRHTTLGLSLLGRGNVRFTGYPHLAQPAADLVF